MLIKLVHPVHRIIKCKLASNTKSKRLIWNCIIDDECSCLNLQTNHLGTHIKFMALEGEVRKADNSRAAWPASCLMLCDIGLVSGCWVGFWVGMHVLFCLLLSRLPLSFFPVFSFLYLFSFSLFSSSLVRRLGRASLLASAFGRLVAESVLSLCRVPFGLGFRLVFWTSVSDILNP